ncbi:MAG: SLC13 family permease [Anaerolineae bacterium]|nr:SLC13 family permease [Anaerolineae bacterium]
MVLTIEIAAFLILFVIGLVLFATEYFSADVTALGLMLALVVLGLLEPDAAFAGYGSETVLMILGLLILSETLIHTGLVDIVGRRLLRFVGKSAQRLRITLLIAPAVMSAFISNTASAAFFLPITLGLANRSRTSVAKVLMPMAFATILAGSVTLIGTSTNLVISGLMQEYGLAPLSMFELTPVGLPILVMGLIYMGTLGRQLIPDRTATIQDDQDLSKHLYFTEIRIPTNSDMVGQTIETSGLIYDMRLGMLLLQRGDETRNPLADTILQANDILLVEGNREDILRLQTEPSVEISGQIRELDAYMQDGSGRIAEVVILPGSTLVGRTVKGLGLRDRYQIQILAVNQSGAIRHSRIGRLTLNIGDILLLKLPQHSLQALEQERMFRILDILENKPINQTKVILSSIIFIASMLLAILGIVPIAVAVLIGAFAAFVTRCIRPDEAYRNIEWKTLILIGSMLAFGQAMLATGTADFLAQWVTSLPGTESPIWLLTLFYFLAVLLTQPMSNQAAAAVLVPIAIQTALALGYNPRAFAAMIAIAASASFITPLEPACVLIYGAGRYKFADFMRVGGLLTILIYIVAIVLVPQVWPL